jgi:hypothetical protein
MPIPSETTRIALEYYKALRSEIVARFQMRDRIMIAYLGATGALLGLGLEKVHDVPSDQQLLQSLLVLLPFLSLGAVSMVAQHQDQVTAYYQYFSTELRASLSDREKSIAMFYSSRAAQEHTPHILGMLFVSQLLLMCGPPVFAMFLNTPYLESGWTTKESMLVVGLLLTILTGWRVWSSMQYRTSVMKRLFAVRGD